VSVGTANGLKPDVFKASPIHLAEALNDLVEDKRDSSFPDVSRDGGANRGLLKTAADGVRP
jgi:hypothetical protein